MPFSAQITGIREALLGLSGDEEREVDRELRSRAFQALADVKLATPVDTGRARNSWSNTPDFIGEDSNEHDIFEVTNSAPYIEYLNGGSSRQAPAMFIESSFLRYFDDVNIEIYDSGEE